MINIADRYTTVYPLCENCGKAMKHNPCAITYRSLIDDETITKQICSACYTFLSRLDGFANMGVIMNMSKEKKERFHYVRKS